MNVATTGKVIRVYASSGLLAVVLAATACSDESSGVGSEPATSGTVTPPSTTSPGPSTAPSTPPSTPPQAPPEASPPTAGAAPGAPTPNSEMPVAGAALDEPPTVAGEGGAVASAGDAGAPGTPSTPPVTPPAEPSAFSPCPTDGAPCAIMPLGDSITFGIGSPDPGGGYRPELFRLASQDQHAITFVGTAAPNGPMTVDGRAFPRNHQGHPGFTISGGGAGSLAGLVDAAINATDPNIVLLMIGTNDINGNIDVANAPNRLGALLDQITGLVPDALLVVAQIVPTTNAGTNTRVQAFNAAIPALVEERVAAGRHLLLVDMYEPFDTTPNFATALMNDVLHPNAAGYVVMANTWYDAIESVLP
jgi:lysophospholipase L1-like esterase